MSDKYRKCVKCGVSAIQDPTLTFHSFPRAGKASNYARVRSWAEFCFEDFTEEDLKGLHKSHKLLCSKHFDRSAYTNDEMKKLNPNAVPNLPVSYMPVELSEKVLVPVNTSEPPQSTLSQSVTPLPGPSCEPVDLEITHVPQKTNLKNITSENQFKKCKKYINQIYRLKQRINKSKDSKTNRKLLLQALSESDCLEKLKKNLKPAFCVLLQSQMTNMPRNLNGRRWTLNEKIIALAMYKKSSACYRLLRRLFCLPNPGTLKSLLNKVNLPCGVNSKVMANLKEITKYQPKRENICMLLFDEMSIRKNLVYNAKTDMIEGYQDHGSQGRRQQIASHALVFMLVGLRKRWKQPIAHYFSGESVTADRLQAILKEVLAECYLNNLDVVATVCDMDGVNMRAINALGSTLESPYFTFQGNEVVTIMDPPHLLKCFRNNFLKHDIKCPENFAIKGISGLAKWQYIKDFYLKDSKNPIFVFAPALTEQHINPNGKQKMKVKLAAQVLSHSVAAGMFAKIATNEISPEAVVTATILSKIDAIFDALNADSPDLKRGKVYSTNLTNQSGHLNLFEEIETLFMSIKFIGARCTPPSVNGWIRTLRAVKRLWHNLQKFNVKAIATRRLNQDPLENLFGCIRGHCGSNPNPNVQQFIAGLKTSIINNLKYKCREKNCEDDANTLLSNMNTYLKTQTKKPTLSSPQLYDIDIPDNIESEENAEDQACAYVCGFIFKKLKNNTCDTCRKIMVSNYTKPVHLFNSFKEYNESVTSLNYVTSDFILCVEACASYTNEFLNVNSHTSEIKKTLSAKLNDRISFNWLDGCMTHKTENINHIVNSVLGICIKRFCVLKNRMFAAEASRNALHRKISILKHT